MLSVAVHKDIADTTQGRGQDDRAHPRVNRGGARLLRPHRPLHLLRVGLNVGDNMMLIYAVSLPFWCCGFIRPKGLRLRAVCRTLAQGELRRGAHLLCPIYATQRSHRLARWEERQEKEGSMGNTIESNAASRESKSTPPVQDASSADTEANFDIEQFVHTSGEGFGNVRPMDADNGSVDVAALGSVAGTPSVAGKKMSRKEKKQAKREVARLKKEAKLAEKEARKSYTSVKSQLKDRDKELTSKTADARRKREGAKDVVNYIGYNRMYQDGICEVEEGLFSSSISFGDTSYHSVRDEQQKSTFSALTRLYDQFGANTLVQMSVINTPLLKEEVGNRKFFDVARQGNDAARNDAQVFNDILNDKVREGVSNIRRNRYLTYSVTAETADDAARQLSRIETESSRILNSMGSKAHLMNGTQRLSVIHSLLNPYKPFYFDYQKDISAKRVQTTKDCIAPTQIDWRPDGMFNDCFKLDNGVYGQVLVMKKFGSELSDRALADIVDLPLPMAVTWFVQPMDKSKAIKLCSHSQRVD